jgi:hypothetical protein
MTDYEGVVKMHNYRDEDLVHFAVAVEGEVATFAAFPKDYEMLIAVYSSNPVFIKVPFDQKPSLGSIWDGTKFSEPGVE